MTSAIGVAVSSVTPEPRVVSAAAASEADVRQASSRAAGRRISRIVDKNRAMEVPRVPPISPADGGLPAGGERPAGGGGDLPFGPGQKLFAQVVQVLAEGRAVLDVGGERLLASTPLPVRTGEVLAVVVRGVGAVVELDIEAPPVAFSERAYALAAVRQAIQQARAVRSR